MLCHEINHPLTDISVLLFDTVDIIGVFPSNLEQDNIFLKNLFILFLQTAGVSKDKHLVLLVQTLVKRLCLTRRLRNTALRQFKQS